MRDKGLDVEYIVFEDEGHGFAKPENRLEFYGEAEKFFARYLGGRMEQTAEE
jgi:dipeptidyl aminopeptidase/acylaminoacyl peptidase